MTVRWQLTEEVFNEAVSLAPERRAAYLDEVCGTDAALREEVESLLRYASDSESYLQALVDDTARDLHSSLPFGEGARVGPYVIQREIARGGMGTVYLAARADGHFQQTVALKVINTEFDHSFALEHFLHERQLLANLQHANIARLLDGGTTESGQPYFAMEYVEGEPLNAYFLRCRTGLAGRLSILEQVCSAIQHAHQQLVIHRDLKPDNVLVTPDGVAKLLDFGIARLLGDERVGERIMTPSYASPEQFRGESPGTASDIYSLGAMLYEAVSGRQPFDFQGKPPARIEQLICTEYPEPLAGDLGDIVRKAMDKDPSRRYPSAEALADDLRRYAGNYPVRARRGGVLYRARKFVARNRLLSAIAAALLVLGATAAGIIAHEAKIAWDRACQVRDLADSLLASYNESADQPETTAQRAQRVRRALDNLGQLSAGTGKDSALDLKIAIAYQRVGDAQGDPTHRSLGDSAGAERSYRASIAILDRLTATGQQLPQAKQELFRAEHRLGILLRATGSAKESLDHFARAAHLVDEVAAGSPKDLDVQNEAAVVYEAMSRVLESLGRDRDSEAANLHALEIFERITRADPANNSYWNGLANCYVDRAIRAKNAGDLKASLEASRKNLEIREAQSARFLSSPNQQRDLMLAYAHMGDVLGYPAMPNLGDYRAAASYYRKCLTTAEAIAGADPTDQTARSDIAMARLRLATILQASNAHGEALQMLRTGMAETERLLQSDPQNKRYLGNAITFRQLLGDQLQRAGEDAPAMANYERALELADRLRARDPSDGGNWLTATADTVIAYSKLVARRRDRARADLLEHRMVDLAVRAGIFHTLVGLAQSPFLYGALGEMRLGLGDADQARTWFQKSAEEWQKLQAAGKLHPMYAKEPARIAVLLATLRH